MREDMFEVIIERPRWGSRMRYSRRNRRGDGKIVSKKNPDALPFQIGLERAAKGARFHKRLSETLNPLRRYLESQVNRPWNKVWSEICANLKTASAVQQHVRDHVKDFVATDILSKDGERWVRTPWRGTVPLSESLYELYVDPRTGILRRNRNQKAWRRARREKLEAEAKELAKRMREVSRYVQLHLFDDGAWWEVKLASLWDTHDWGTRRNHALDKPHPDDVVLSTSLSRLPPTELYARSDVYAVAKRQLSRKEAAKFGLPR